MQTQHAGKTKRMTKVESKQQEICQGSPKWSNQEQRMKEGESSEEKEKAT